MLPPCGIVSHLDGAAGPHVTDNRYMRFTSFASAMVETGVDNAAVAVVFAWVEGPGVPAPPACSCATLEPGVRARDFRMAAN